MYENWTEVLTFTPANGNITNIDHNNKTVTYSGWGRCTGVYIKLLDENGRNISVDTDIEIIGKMPQGGRNPYLKTHNGDYPIFLDENNSFKIRTRYKGSQLYIGIIDGQIGGWNVSLEIEDIKIFKNKKEDSELDLIPSKMILNNINTSVLVNEIINQYISCEVGSMESLQYISDTPQLISFNEGKLNTLAIGNAKFHVVNKYGIGKRYEFKVIDEINIKPIIYRKVLPKGEKATLHIIVSPKYLTDSVEITTTDGIVFENGIVQGTLVGDESIVCNINYKDLSDTRTINFKIVDNGENQDNIYHMKHQDLQVGTTYATKGYYSDGDGGEATYEIVTYDEFVEGLPEDIKTVNFGTGAVKTPVDEFGNHTLDNGLVARLVKPNNVTKVEQWGCIGDGKTDNAEPLIHLFGQTKTGEIVFGKDKEYVICSRGKNVAYFYPEKYLTDVTKYKQCTYHQYGAMMPHGIGGAEGGKPMLANIKDVVLNGNNCTITIPKNDFACVTNEFGVINLLGDIDGLEIKNFTFQQNGLSQITYLDDNAEVKDQMTRGHCIAYVGGRTISNLNIHHNKFYECGTTINSNDCGGDFVLIINPTASENVFIEDNEFYDWGRWVYSVDLGGSGERFYNYKFNRNKCIQTANNYLRYRADKDTYRSYRGLGWIDFEARKCFTNLEVCDNIVDGACGFAINGNGKVSENVSICRNTINRPDKYYGEVAEKDGVTSGWRGVYNYTFNWYGMHGKDVLFEDNIVNYGGIGMAQCFNLTIKNNNFAEWGGFGSYPIFGEIILDGNVAPGERSCVMNLNFGGNEAVYKDFGLDNPYTHVLVNNHNGGGFYGKQRTGLTNAYRPVTLEFTGDNHFNKMDLNVFGYAKQVEFNPQWMNPDINFAIRGAKFTAPTTRKYTLSHNWKAYYDGFIGCGFYNEGEIIYEENNLRCICTETGIFPTQPAFLLVDDHDNYYERVVNANVRANSYIFTRDDYYIVYNNGTTGTIEEFPHHSNGEFKWGSAVLRHLGHVGKFKKEVIENQ